MVNIIKEELSLEESLRKKIEFICDFTNKDSLWLELWLLMKSNIEESDLSKEKDDFER